MNSKLLISTKFLKLLQKWESKQEAMCPTGSLVTFTLKLKAIATVVS